MVTKKVPRKGKLIKLSDAELKMLADVASDAGLDGSNWIRHTINAAHKRLTSKSKR
jgi:hypothetical protein